MRANQAKKAPIWDAIKLACVKQRAQVTHKGPPNLGALFCGRTQRLGRSARSTRTQRLGRSTRSHKFCAAAPGHHRRLERESVRKLARKRNTNEGIFYPQIALISSTGRLTQILFTTENTETAPKMAKSGFVPPSPKRESRFFEL